MTKYDKKKKVSMTRTSMATASVILFVWKNHAVSHSESLRVTGRS